MQHAEILIGLNEIFQDVMENESILINEETTANDVAEWNSLTNIELIVAVEKKYAIRFTSTDIESWRSVGDMVNSIVLKMK